MICFLTHDLQQFIKYYRMYVQWTVVYYNSTMVVLTYAVYAVCLHISTFV